MLIKYGTSVVSNLGPDYFLRLQNLSGEALPGQGRLETTGYEVQLAEKHAAKAKRHNCFHRNSATAICMPAVIFEAECRRSEDLLDSKAGPTLRPCDVL